MKTKQCMNNLASCFCWRKADHKGLHKCRCEGSWDSKGIPHDFPNLSYGFNAFPNTEKERKLLGK